MKSAPILSVAQMRAAEQALFDAGVAPYDLMVRAGETAAELIWRVGHKRETLVLCGPGNNGGDGFVIARALRDLGVPVRVAALGESRTESSATARTAWAAPVEDLMKARPSAQLVDALFGIGLTRGLDGAVSAKLAALVAAAQHSYAIDVPSGVESDAAVALSPVPFFTHCIALGAWKPAHKLMPARALAAQNALVDIGIEAPVGCTQSLAVPHFEAPAPDSHKYRRGLVAVIAGDMPGAASLAVEAAARSGAGYARLISENEMLPASSRAIVHSRIMDFSRARAILVGSGLGRGPAAWERLVTALKAGLPTVVDGDAHGLLAQNGFGDLPRPAIVTPHEGEFDQLFGDDSGNKIDNSRSAAERSGMVIVHKGPDTVIAAPDGRCVVAPPASSWLSTAGTGDVLAGLCVGRLAVTGDPFRAACEAVWFHGEAARRAGAAFVADDLIAHVPAALASAA